MKKTMLILALGAFISSFAIGQNQHNLSVEKLIQSYSLAGDNFDLNKLDDVLDSNYRLVMNRLFGSQDVVIMSKDDYLSKIKSKEFGGDKRTPEILSIVYNKSCATAKVLFRGEKNTYTSILDMVSDSDGNWTLISDSPIF